ncbi:MAG TPA: 4-alpha-glucanotransferase [Longimicrobiales bacterium]|nr:4-alpha-glucanotransferase [Longimicrobiales bacterium]
MKRSYLAMDDRRVTASSDATRAVLAALGADVESGDTRAVLRHEEEMLWQRALGPVVVAWDGDLADVRLRLPASVARKTVELAIKLEDGRQLVAAIPPAQRTVVQEKKIGRSKFVEATFAIEDRLPTGYHELRITSDLGEAEATILSAPTHCYAGGAERTWGLFAPLYATRNTRDKPIGDLSELEQLLTWTGSWGGSVVATLPISAAFLTAPFDPSPYSPASRLFWNELFLDLDRLLANSDSVPARNRALAGEWQHAMRAAAAGDYVDYREVAQLKRHVLEALADWFFLQNRQHSDAFREFTSLYPDAEQYARFRATGERQGRGWPGWPPRARAGVLESHDYDDDAARYHLYAQFVMHSQLESLAQRSRRQGSALYLDMPLGVHPDSFDVWRMPDLFVTGVSAGAPPDAFFTRGQNWGFPPLHPRTMREQRYAYWRRVLSTQFRYAGMLRIDHVMSLHRLFFVPAGYEATDGVYVRYPEDELYAVLTIESQRHGSAVVGEDLGTVPAEVRRSMKQHGVKRMYVVQFEAHTGDPPIEPVPGGAVVSLNTHDMPPFAAFWHGRDAELRQEMGLLDAAEVKLQHQRRDQLARALSSHLRAVGALDGNLRDRVFNTRLEAPQALPALLDWMARSPADISLINLEDLWLEEEPQNVPGTSHEKPNWRRRMRYTLQEIMSHEEIAGLLDRMNAARQEGNVQV